jgi:hypothetical protein
MNPPILIPKTPRHRRVENIRRDTTRPQCLRPADTRPSETRLLSIALLLCLFGAALLLLSLLA